MKKNIFMTIIFLWVYVAECTQSITQQVIDQGPLIINEPGAWILAESIVTERDVAFVINAQGVMFDLQGHVIDGNNKAKIAFDVRAHDCTIKNGTIKSFDDSAIRISDSSFCTLADLTILYSHQGIVCYRSSQAYLKNITLESIIIAGIACVDSASMYVTQSFITSCAQGIAITGSSVDTVVEGVYIKNVQQDALFCTSDSLTCSYVMCESCGNGIVIQGSNSVLSNIQSNKSTGSGFLVSGSNIKINSCIAFSNKNDGLRIAQNAKDVRVLGGAYAGNGKAGIRNMGGVTNTGYGIATYTNAEGDMIRIVNNMR